MIPRNPDNLEFLQPAQCAYADDLAVASLSIRGLMTALAPAFRCGLYCRAEFEPIENAVGCNMEVEDVNHY